MADYDKFELPFCVKPHEIKAEQVEKVGFGVKIKCFLPIELFDVLKYLMFFNINGKKAYLSASNNNEKNIDCTFILVNTLSYEQVQDFCIKSKTKVRIARWNDAEQNETTINSLSDNDIQVISDIMLQFLNVFENVAKTIREKINNGEYDEIIKKHLIDAIGKNN